MTSRVDPMSAGQCADVQRLITGTSSVPSFPVEVVPLIGDLGRWLSQAPATAETAIAAHERLMTIHLFVYGSGRTARVLVNLALLRGGYPPVLIGPEHRTEYNDSLQPLQVGCDPLAYRRFMAERLDASVDHHLFVLRREQEQEPTHVSSRGL